jgi:hypothetical protein
VKLDKDREVIKGADGKPKDYWVSHHSCTQYATVLRYFGWKDVQPHEVAGKIEKIGGIAAVLEMDKRFLARACINSKAELDKPTALKNARTKLRGTSQMKSYNKSTTWDDSHGFVLLIGQVDSSGNATIKSSPCPLGSRLCLLWFNYQVCIIVELTTSVEYIMVTARRITYTRYGIRVFYYL